MEKRLKDNELYKDLKNQEIKPKFHHLMYRIGTKNKMDDFLQTKIAQGIISNDLSKKFKETKKTSINSHLWLYFTIDCWLSTVYNMIWSERCNAVKEKNKI